MSRNLRYFVRIFVVESVRMITKLTVFAKVTPGRKDYKIARFLDQ